MRLVYLFAVLVATILGGCAANQTPISPRTPHGGMLLALPDSPNSIEIVRQEVVGKPDSSRLILFYLDADQKPLTPAPTAATLKLRGRGARSIDFKPSSETDPSRAGGLESAEIPERGGIDGELSTNVNGKSVALAVSVR
jgi:hypothetical protein